MAANVDGDWDVVIKTPMGDQAFLLSLVSDGDIFSGHASGELGSTEIEGGRIDGDVVSWPFLLTKPFPMKLSVRATVSGGSIAGSVDAGFMGMMPLSGSRRS